MGVFKEVTLVISSAMLCASTPMVCKIAHKVSRRFSCWNWMLKRLMAIVSSAIPCSFHATYALHAFCPPFANRNNYLTFFGYGNKHTWSEGTKFWGFNANDFSRFKVVWVGWVTKVNSFFSIVWSNLFLFCIASNKAMRWLMFSKISWARWSSIVWSFLFKRVSILLLRAWDFQ